MTESLINEWLADYADVSPAELPTFANTLSQDNEIVRALYVLLEERNNCNFILFFQLIDPVCNQLFNFYRSREVQLQRFTLQFVPTLIFIYLNALAHGDIKLISLKMSIVHKIHSHFFNNCRSVETLLIGLYNLEVVSETGDSKTVSFRLPSLAMLSIYHEPSSLTHASLTESAVRHFEECNSKLVSWGPLPQIETLNAQNRLKVMTALLFIYNQQLSYIQKSALEQLCKVATKLVTQGFPKPGHHQRASYNESSFVPRLLPRIPVTNQFLLEFLHGIYFAMYNDCWYVGCQAVDDIHNRVCYDGYADVMLVTNAIRNSSSSGPSGLLGDASLGISVALSPATTTPTISKSMITNASFRTKKLPDDLDVNLFEDEVKSIDEKEKLPRPSPSSGKRRAWLRKHMPQSLDEDEVLQVRSGGSSVDNSRRESLASQASGSPSRTSPKKSRDRKVVSQDDVIRRPRRERSDSPGNESRLSAGARLYRVLEEQALGEAIVASAEGLYINGLRAIERGKPGNITAGALSIIILILIIKYLFIDDIPIVAKEDGTADKNLVSISEEQDSTEPSRIGSLRQGKDKSSKITNFSLTKKPREKDSRAKNGMVEKEKKSGQIKESKSRI
ncbi:GSCOCG00006865001-RA-CDS, partial [Cotesia congregata]